MKKKHSLCKNWQFQDIINLKKSKITKTLIIYYRKAKEFKIGISIPKKFAIAVKRNYYKRQIKNILQKQNIFYIKKEIVLIVRESFLQLSFEQKKNELREILEKITNGKR